MSKRKNIVNKKRPEDIASLDNFVLESEIEYTLRRLESVYQRNITILDNYEKFVDNPFSIDDKKNK